MTKTSKGHLAAFVTNLLYGANFSIVKLVMPDFILPSGLVLMRVLFALIMFFIFAQLRAGNEKIERSDWLKLFFCGIFGVAINQLLFLEGLARTSNINAALIMTTNPVMVLIAASVIIKERITMQKTFGILLGLAGASLLILFGTITKNRDANWHGDLMIFLNAASYSVFLVMVKPLMKKYHPLTVIKWTFVFGTIFVIPFGIGEASVVQWSQFTGTVWLSLFYVLFFTTFIVYLLTTYSLKNLSPSVVSFYIYLQPIFATLLTLLLQHEKPTMIQATSCILIFMGVYLVSVKKEKA
jgi:drug/metabolite transporter (DMT)-like permease